MSSKSPGQITYLILLVAGFFGIVFPPFLVIVILIAAAVIISKIK